jgi:hypothetical protein
VSAQHRHATADPARATATLKKRRLDEAARLLIETVVAEGRLKLAGSQFLKAAEGLDQRLVVESAVERLRTKLPRASVNDCTAAVWGDCYRLFGWPGDVADLEPGGRT